MKGLELKRACRAGNLTAIIELINGNKCGFDVDMYTLVECLLFKNYHCVEWLIENLENVRLYGLSYVLRNIHSSSEVGPLLKCGVSLNIRDDTGKTELHHANYSKFVTKLLLEARSDVNAVDNSGETALDCAIKGPNRDSVDILMWYGARVRDTSPIWAKKAQIAIDHAIDARNQAIIALMYVLRVNKCPKDLTRHIAKCMFNETKCDDAWFIVETKRFLF